MQKAVSKMLPHSSAANCIYLCGCIQTSVLCNKTQMTCFTIMKYLFLFHFEYIQYSTCFYMSFINKNCETLQALHFQENH